MNKSRNMWVQSLDGWKIIFRVNFELNNFSDGRIIKIIKMKRHQDILRILRTKNVYYAKK